MKYLVFDTCFNKSYIVLKNNCEILANIVIESTNDNYHSAFLIPKIRDILRDNHIQIKDLDAIGVNIGPGSFTGIRAGITIARVFAQQAEIKLIGIESLKILSNINTDKTKRTTVILDARKNKAYYAVYDKYNEIVAPSLVEKDELVQKINKNDIIITDTSIFTFLQERNIKCINYENCDENIGLFLSDIVYNSLKNEKNSDYNWANVKPLYIQKPSITMPKVVKNV